MAPANDEICDLVLAGEARKEAQKRQRRKKNETREGGGGTRVRIAPLAKRHKPINGRDPPRDNGTADRNAATICIGGYWPITLSNTGNSRAEFIALRSMPAWSVTR